MLAEKWGEVKTHHVMDWNKVSKVSKQKSYFLGIVTNIFQILELYLRKKLIKLCSGEAMIYQFLIVPKHVKQDELCIL